MAIEQQINLYRIDMSLKQGRARRRKVQGVIALVVAGLLVHLGVEGWAYQSKRANLQALQAAHQQQVSALARAEVELGLTETQINDLTRLEKQLQQAQAQKASLERALGISSTGFSQYLTAFARQHLGGLWLTHVNVYRGGENVVFGGRSVDPALVPRYVGRLAEEQVLKGVNFEALQISQGTAKVGRTPNYVEFRVASEALEDEGLL